MFTTLELEDNLALGEGVGSDHPWSQLRGNPRQALHIVSSLMGWFTFRLSYPLRLTGNGLHVWTLCINEV